MLITNSRSQTWSVEYRPRGADLETGKRFPTRSVTIGTPATHSPDSALAEALKIKGATKTGKDPAAERRATIAEAARARSATVERAVSDYLATLPTKEKKGGGASPRDGPPSRNTICAALSARSGSRPPLWRASTSRRCADFSTARPIGTVSAR
jgi:hypothetical protein